MLVASDFDLRTIYEIAYNKSAQQILRVRGLREPAPTRQIDVWNSFVKRSLPRKNSRKTA